MDSSLYSVIDIGSNTVKYNLYRLSPDGTPAKIGGGSVTVRLLQFITDGRLSEDGLDRLCGVLADFQAASADARVPAAHLLCTATAAFRRLRDPAAVIAEILRRTGVSVRLLSGEEEASLSFRGMLLTASPRPTAGLMLDMGGGSTECTLFAGGVPLSSRSHPFGALSLYDRFVAGEFPTAAEAAAISAAVRETVMPFLSAPVPPSEDGLRRACIVGGTAKAIAALNPTVVLPDRRFTVESFRAQLSGYLSGEGLDKVREDYPDRYRVIVPGMVAYDTIFDLSGISAVQVADGGLRDGVLEEFLINKRGVRGAAAFPKGKLDTLREDSVLKNPLPYE